MGRAEETDMKYQQFVIASLIFFAAAVGSSCGQQTSPNEGGSQQVDPAIVDLPISASTVTDVHLHPFFTTTIRLAEWKQPTLLFYEDPQNGNRVRTESRLAFASLYQWPATDRWTLAGLRGLILFRQRKPFSMSGLVCYRHATMCSCSVTITGFL